MSLKPMEIPPVPEETARVARAAFPKGTPFLRFRDELGVIYRDEMFAALFPKRGQPATAPWRLALISVFQYVEGLSDRQAAEAVRSRIDWKYSLGLELSDPGFDFSVLCEFRRRLVDGDLGPVLLDALLVRLRDRGLLKARGQQRTDATHVLAAIRQINRLENIGETLRAALNAVAAVAPDWLARQVSPEWFERYAVRVEMSRLPKGETERQCLAETMGADGHALLAAVYDPAAPVGLCDLPAVQTLRLTWVRQFLIEEGRVRLRQPADTPPASLNGYTPYDTDARFGKKRDITWIGYKAHLSETCDPGEPHVIVNVLTTPAPMTDMEVTALVHQSLASRNLLPTTHFVDAAYVDAGLLTASRADHGIELVGPLLPNTSWQARAAEGYDLSAFRINWDAHTVTCPQGQVATHWTSTLDKWGSESIRVSFPRPACAACSARPQCTHARDGNARTLSFRPQAEHEAIQEARRRQETVEWRQQHARRAGVEGTLSQAVGRFGLRRCRYIGLRKTGLQHIFTAVALNLARIDAWLTGKPVAKTRTSTFAALLPAVS
jgi:transposase